MSIVSHQEAKESSGVLFHYPMLNSSNYTVWAIKMEAILDAQEVWEAVEPAEGALVDSKKDKKARAYILQSVPEDILLQIAKKKTAKETWDSLKTRFLGADRVKKARLQMLKSEFDAFQMKENESIDEFAGKLSGMSSRYSSLGTTLNDAALVKKLLDSVPDKYFQVVAGIEQFYDIETMPFEEAIGRLKLLRRGLSFAATPATTKASSYSVTLSGRRATRAAAGTRRQQGRGKIPTLLTEVEVGGMDQAAAEGPRSYCGTPVSCGRHQQL